MIYLIPLVVFTSVLLLAVVFYQVAVRKSVVAERLESLFPREKTPVKQVESGTWEYKLSRLGSLVSLPEKEQSRCTRLLVAAGYHRESIFHFQGSKLVCACVLPVLYFFLYAAPRHALLDRRSWLVLVICAISGYLTPTYWIYQKKKRRQLQIFHTLPDILDLVTVCVEAGLSMDAALIRTIDTPQFVKDPLAMEIKAAAMEIRAGKPRIEALKDMAERTQVPDVRAFVTMLAQTERFGTSLSRALRSHADSLRTKRRQSAEEAAAKTTIKMIFPLILFIMPALLVVILGPALIQIFKVFK